MGDTQRPCKEIVRLSLYNKKQQDTDIVGSPLGRLAVSDKLPPSMPRTKGSRDLSDEEKAKILAEKNLRLATRNEIAKQHGVCRDTVHRIVPEAVSLEVAQRAKEIEASVLKRIEKTRDKALTKLEAAIDDDNIRPESLINAFSTLYDKARVEGGQPTSHTGFSPEQVEKFKTGFRNLLVNLFQHFKADEERPEPLTIEQADALVRIALGEK